MLLMSFAADGLKLGGNVLTGLPDGFVAPEIKHMDPPALLVPAFKAGISLHCLT